MINLLLQAAGIVGFNIPILSGSPSPTHVSPKPTATIRKDYSRFLPGFAEPVSPVSLGDGVEGSLQVAKSAEGDVSVSPVAMTSHTGPASHEAEAADVDQQVSESELVETKSETVVESKYARLGRLLLEPMAEDFYKSDDEDGFYGSDDYFKNAQIKPPPKIIVPLPAKKEGKNCFLKTGPVRSRKRSEICADHGAGLQNNCPLHDGKRCRGRSSVHGMKKEVLKPELQPVEVEMESAPTTSLPATSKSSRSAKRVRKAAATSFNPVGSKTRRRKKL